MSDTIDLNELKWVRGGYDRTGLSNVYTLSGARAQRRADHVIQSLARYAADMDEVKALGFCTGSKPMNIVWKLEKPIPAKYLRRVQQVMG